MNHTHPPHRINNSIRIENRADISLLGASGPRIFYADPFEWLRKMQWTNRDIFVGIGILAILWACRRLSYFIGRSVAGDWLHVSNFILLNLMVQLYIFLFPYLICKKRNIIPRNLPLSISVIIKEFLHSMKYLLYSAFIIGIIISLISHLFDIELEVLNKHIPITKKSHQNLYLYLLILGFTFFPFFEEVFFRGFLLNAFNARMPIYPSIVLQSIIFTIGHSGNILNWIRIFLIGIALAIIYERRKNLLTPIFVHVWINLLFTISYLGFFG